VNFQKVILQKKLHLCFKFTILFLQIFQMNDSRLKSKTKLASQEDQAMINYKDFPGSLLDVSSMI